MEEIRLLSTQEISKHDSAQDCWLVIDEAVWDCTAFANSHPGGSSLILNYAGRDATKAYSEVHSPSIVRESLSPEYFKGNLDRSTIDKAWTKEPLPSNPAQAVPEHEKPPLHTIINLNDFEEASARSTSAKTHAFYSTAATDCWTRDMNSSMLKRIWFRPRVLKNVAEVDTSSSMLSIPLRVPVFICPSGLAKMINPEGEKALARAAKSSGIVEIISTNASYPAAEIIEQAPDHPFMFQLYVNKDRKKSEELVKHVEQLGVKAIFVTVDAAGRGKRESDERLRVDEVAINPLTGEKSKTGKKGGGLTKIVGQFIDQGLTWEDLKWLRSLTKLPILLKGIMTAEDAKLAMKHKVDGILVSNHGGRNLDFSPPSILVLLELHKQCPEIFDQMEVYVDGGFRRGGDILKALCLGAKAVGMGRPFLFALNYGTEGAEHLVEILKDEMESAMKLLGIKDLSEVHPGLVNTSDVDHLVPSTSEHPYAKWRPKAKI
ncbi:unnamed protein product [Zymoseptoria tritici ST99CH_3D1]|uniref:L-lactate dehydrogenase (cytochrome) n=3 Tax=Zymoseptoria tritici TaxID=1047171 RepID=F9WZN4_ZYMTI|nr:uncharacterized protein MYCGRDRAFT_65123 [Zymoseptoria tritici IPO323]EGP90919.1 hypothetical protein MYCGRDRAFT_65123 [Zymoseptoria tritici IPO323]SMQ45121.1 unnamed protein product [Zymoseptoria tritici ST99CH_3D7]SMR41475.1 unnamed protein product [Zymoseptoria tritici ST99CH_1E4]SMR43676.1 unnamed protein product [Zymoseptoria tritici ST99CH_3D1]